ncbi:permease for cytosine/purines, uracil, thiamine, allantoin-domain-containing protein [Aspergillus pseudotamarii]|uniref:Permease for cytosine/purines, uracil, thiamine, allantoin-domain-containing protein n=1 Tax=Aspergillus pseudotamarii TaxID=132259 RepID=A0A5N6T686_ASPPS|nr:permease for cytosine/purines, uracil, thiamine, allantoin-domain-containing protein [Aspergillus pseudotamarii]KAE8141810.1 permease for cytosine/purines, uracil, thiamine, allantoin-domain-containing protein [Aspergillus pseudotamarii]
MSLLFKYLLDKIRLPAVEGHLEQSQWVNEDLLPTPPEKQTWRWWNYVTLSWSINFTNWTLGSSMIGIGLSWWQSIVVIFVSQLICSIAMAFNSRAASVYHIGYPCVARSVFGMWGSYYFVGVRAVMAVIWYGVQVYYGAEYMYNILRAIFGHHFTDIPNRLPVSAGITSSLMLAFFLCWLIQLPFCHFRPYQLRKFFWFKSIVSLPSMFGLFIWAMVDTKGRIGSLSTSTSRSSSATAWLILAGINSGIGNLANLITNQPDYSRWSNTPNASVWTQLVVTPISVALSASFGIIATTAVNSKYGTNIWNQWDLMNLILDHYWSSGARFAVFLCAFAWLVQIVGTNIAANMISFGADSSMLLPAYIDMRRGQYIVEFLAWAVCPWKILASATKFQDFLSGYALFMSSVVAIMLCDYFLLTKGTVVIPSLYNPTNTNENYYYHGGWNLQALAAYIVGIALPFPGFCGVLGASVSTAASHIMDIAWVTSFVTSFIVYFAICWIWPTQNMKFVRERGYTFEQIAPTSGYCDSGPSKDEETIPDNAISSKGLKAKVEI